MTAVELDHEQMVRDMCAAADSGDAERFGSYFADTACYRFANAEPLHGRESIVASTAGTVAALPTLRHRVDQVARIGDQLFCRFTIETTAPDGRELALPCVTVIELAGRQIVDYRVHMDISPALAI